MSRRMVVPVGNEMQFIVEVFDNDNELPSEIFVYLQTPNGDYDICMTRPHYEYDYTLGKPKVFDNKIDCMVWADPNNDDFTNQFIIDVD